MWRSLAGFVALAMLVASCAGRDDVTSAEDGSASDESPLEELLGMPLFDQAEFERWMADLEVERRLLVAECMRAEGFDYPLEVGTPSQRLETELEPDSREFAQEFGFGVVARFRQAIFDPSVDYSTAEDRYVATLSESERDAYETALRGDDGTPGCDDEATEQVSRVFDTSRALQPLVVSLGERMATDSRMLELTQRWTDCMAEAGFPDSRPETLQASFFDRLFEILVGGPIFEYSPSDLPPEIASQFAPGTEPSRDDAQTQDPFTISTQFGLEVYPPLSPEGKAKIDSLFVEEVSAAVAAFDCRAPIREDEAELWREYEADFVLEAEKFLNEEGE